MTNDEIYEMFQQYNENYLKFEKIKNKLSSRSDLHALILLDKKFPIDSDRNIIFAANRGIVFLDIKIEDLNKHITKEIIYELVCCGICFDTEYERLYFNV